LALSTCANRISLRALDEHVSRPWVAPSCETSSEPHLPAWTKFVSRSATRILTAFAFSLCRVGQRISISRQHFHPLIPTGTDAALGAIVPGSLIAGVLLTSSADLPPATALPFNISDYAHLNTKETTSSLLHEQHFKRTKLVPGRTQASIRCAFHLATFAFSHVSYCPARPCIQNVPASMTSSRVFRPDAISISLERWP
jgi:hypothetical protein